MPKTITLYELNGQRFTLGHWSSIYGVPVGRVTARVKAGWSLERALTEPVHKQTITYRNQTLTLGQWSEKTGLAVATIRQRLNNGWPPVAILSTPARLRMQRPTYNRGEGSSQDQERRDRPHSIVRDPA